MHSKIVPSELVAGVMLQARILCHSSRETAFSPESTAGSSEAEFNGSLFCADRRWGFVASSGLKVREETGRLSPPQSVTAYRLSSMVIGRCVPDYI